MTIRLKISPIVRFDVKFTLNDEGVERDFGFVAEAERAREPATGETIGAYLTDKARVRMVEWIDGGNPLTDDNGQPAPAGPEALAALYELVSNMPGHVYARYSDAVAAKLAKPRGLALG